jgi:ribosome modulation factor
LAEFQQGYAARSVGKRREECSIPPWDADGREQWLAGWELCDRSFHAPPLKESDQ